MIRAIKSELLKIRSTNTWWLIGLGVLAFTALALLFNCIEAHFELKAPDAPSADASSQDRANYQAELNTYNDHRSSAGLAKIAANIFTSGQFLGVMLIMVLCILIVTNEFFHQTATSTFLTTPHRTTVIIAKYLTGIIVGAIGWLIATVPSAVVTIIFFKSEDLSGYGDWRATRSILLNLAAYMIWAVLGVGLGVMIRSQVGAVVTGTTTYLVGTYVVAIFFMLIHSYLIKKDWVLTAQVIVPAIASIVMTTPGGGGDHLPDQWVGAAVLIGYGLIFGIIGTALVRSRDVS